MTSPALQREFDRLHPEPPVYQPAPLRRTGLRPWMLLAVLAAGFLAMSFGIPAYFIVVAWLGGIL